MNNQVFIFVCSTFMPVLMIVFGFILWKHHPEKINYFFGFRTSRSMLSLDTWKFANEYGGKLWFIWGWIALVPTVFVFLPFFKTMEGEASLIPILVIVLQAVIMMASVIPVNIALKKKFDDEGKPL